MNREVTKNAYFCEYIKLLYPFAMSSILSDREIEKLIGKVILNGNKDLLNPNGIELRLGKNILFHSSDEEIEITEGCYIKIKPGETITITSFEQLDFSRETVNEIFPDSMLMGWITPTTTMMREGISQLSTKVDAGFKGTLNWALRNGSAKDIILGHCEPIYKLTLYKLEGDEVPQTAYGERNKDQYQLTEGISRSKRTIPSQIASNKMFESNIEKVDPKKQLKEAGYPFNYIGTELTELNGKLEIVSKDFVLVKDQFGKKTDELNKKIEGETKVLFEKIDRTEISLIDKTKSFFTDQFTKIAGVVIGAIAIIGGGITFLQGRMDNESIGFTAAILGLGVIVITILLTRKSKA